MNHKCFSRNEILNMEPMFRRNFINSVEGIKSLVLIGTQNAAGVANVAPFNSLVHIGATPPQIGFIHRPATVPKQTFTNIQIQQAFTINLVTVEQIEAAHQSSARYAPEDSEFDKTGLTAEYARFGPVPYVKESPVKFGLSLAEIVPIRSSGGFLIIGNVEEIHFPEELLSKDGHISYEESALAAVVGLDSYYKTSLVAKLPYARRK